MILMSGVYDPFTIDRHGPRAWFNERMMWAYAGVHSLSADDRFKLMSVPTHVTAAFPPSYISSGNADPLEAQAVVLANRLQALGVRTDTLFFRADHSPPLPHQYQFNLDRPEGRKALEQMLAFLRQLAFRP
jgi:acetyl esterase/lipase